MFEGDRPNKGPVRKCLREDGKMGRMRDPERKEKIILEKDDYRDEDDLQLAEAGGSEVAKETSLPGIILCCMPHRRRLWMAANR